MCNVSKHNFISCVNMKFEPDCVHQIGREDVSDHSSGSIRVLLSTCNLLVSSGPLACQTPLPLLGGHVIPLTLRVLSPASLQPSASAPRMHLSFPSPQVIHALPLQNWWAATVQSLSLVCFCGSLHQTVELLWLQWPAVIQRNPAQWLVVKWSKFMQVYHLFSSLSSEVSLFHRLLFLSSV